MLKSWEIKLFHLFSATSLALESAPFLLESPVQPPVILNRDLKVGTRLKGGGTVEPVSK